MKTNPVKHILAALTCGIVLTGASISLAQNPTPATGTMTTSAAISHSDKNFVEKAAKGGAEEVALSQVALERSTNPQVKEFAQMMVTDHNDANSQLMSFAQTKGVELSSKEINVKKWQKKDAKDFDADYISQMIDDHKDAVKLFQKESTNGEDGDLKAFAEKTLPTLQSHLDKAQEIKAALK